MDRITEKTMEETGLNRLEADFYECFYMSTGLDDKVILYGEVKHRITQLIRKGENKGTDEKFKEAAEMIYDHLLNSFREKGLIHKIEAQFSMAAYPVLIGYNPFDDKEFYIAHRKRGTKKWNGRFSTELLSTVGKQLLREGHEFR